MPFQRPVAAEPAAIGVLQAACALRNVGTWAMGAGVALHLGAVDPRVTRVVALGVGGTSIALPLDATAAANNPAGLVMVLGAVAGLVFEYYVGPEKH